MEHEELTSKIIEACFEVMNELGEGFLESVYENSLSSGAGDQLPQGLIYEDRFAG